MPVKTFKKRKGESWFSVAERKFGDRDIGYDLIKKFGEGRSGVQYRFNSDTARGKAGIGRAFAEALGLDPLGGAGVGVVGTGAGEFVPPTAPTLPGQREFPDKTQDVISELLGGLEATGGPLEGGQRFSRSAEINTLLGGLEATGGPSERFQPPSPGVFGGPLEGGRIPNLPPRERLVSQMPPPFERDFGNVPADELSREQEINRQREQIQTQIDAIDNQVNIDPLAQYRDLLDTGRIPRPQEPSLHVGLTGAPGWVDPTTGKAVGPKSPTNHPGGWNWGEVTAQANIYSTMFEDGGAPPAMADITARLALEDMDGYEGVLIASGYVFNDETG